jgi:hypothetical protein
LLVVLLFPRKREKREEEEGKRKRMEIKKESKNE